MCKKPESVTTRSCVNILYENVLEDTIDRTITICSRRKVNVRKVNVRKVNVRIHIYEL